MATVDPTTVFDLVNIDLLIWQLKIIGMPEDVVTLIDIWLRYRSFLVELNGEVSMVKLLLCGVVQGSIIVCYFCCSKLYHFLSQFP